MLPAKHKLLPLGPVPSDFMMHKPGKASAFPFAPASHWDSLRRPLLEAREEHPPQASGRSLRTLGPHFGIVKESSFMGDTDEP